MKQHGSGTFTGKSTKVQSVRSRIAEIEELHKDGVKEGTVEFGFLKTFVGYIHMYIFIFLIIIIFYT